MLDFESPSGLAECLAGSDRQLNPLRNIKVGGGIQQNLIYLI